MASRIWKGHLSFGLINIPVELANAETHDKLKFSMVDRESLAPVGYRRINKQTGEEIDWSNIVKGYDLGDGRLVLLEKEDFEKANVRASHFLELLDFVESEDLDFMLFNRPYYLLPQKGGEKGYLLLREALKKKKRVAIGKIVIRQKQHLAAILQKEDYLVLELLRFAHEIKLIDEVQILGDKLEGVLFSDKELKMAEQLIEGTTSHWEPEKYQDTYREDLESLIQRKAESGGVEISEEEYRIPSSNTNVTDLMPLLKKSLAEAKKSRTRSNKRKAR